MTTKMVTLYLDKETFDRITRALENHAQDCARLADEFRNTYGADTKASDPLYDEMHKSRIVAQWLTEQFENAPEAKD